jgi:hypothetical protein
MRQINLLDDESNTTIVVTMDELMQCDFVCKNYVLNGMENTFYDR